MWEVFLGRIEIPIKCVIYFLRVFARMETRKLMLVVEMRKTMMVILFDGRMCKEGCMRGAAKG